MNISKMASETLTSDLGFGDKVRSSYFPYIFTYMYIKY